MKIARQMISCAALVLLAAATAFSQTRTFYPTTGALLTINGTVTEGANTMNVSLSISDKDIHSGTTQTVPLGTEVNGGNCAATDQDPTDAYVLQAGAPTGCDPGNGFEGGLTPGNFSFSSDGGLVSYNLGVSTSYWINPYTSKCNSSEAICSNNTSFLTVQNNSSTSSFTGTITLAASSRLCGPVSDSFTGTLKADVDASVTLALAMDASSCGGFTGLMSQTQILVPGVQTIYRFNTDDNVKITASASSLPGKSLTVTFVPTVYSAFTPPPNRPYEACIPFGDISPTSPTAPLASDVCGLLQFDCFYMGVLNGGDCLTYQYDLLVVYDLPPNLPAIGGPDGLIVHGVPCPTSGVNAQDIFYSYSVARDDPTTHTVGTGTGSCVETTYTPGAPLITGANTTVSTSGFVGFGSPVSDTELNLVKAGSTRPLKFQLLDINGNPVTTLNLCPNMTGTGCTPPWINFTSFGIVCPNGAAIDTATNTTISSPGNSGLSGGRGGNYHLNWQTSKLWNGSCANVRLTFDSGLVVVPAALGFEFN
jgi:hypothetical protein